MKRHHGDTENGETPEKSFRDGSEESLCGLGVLRVSVVNPNLWK
jgi:hypothetical protein